MKMSEDVLKFFLDDKNSLLINPLSGAGIDCKDYAVSVISEFIELMKDKILERTEPGKLVSINHTW